MQPSTTEQQERLHQDFTAALDLLDRQGREPDRWEEECLAYALGAIGCGLSLAAEVELEAFARPASEREMSLVGVVWVRLSSPPSPVTSTECTTMSEFESVRAMSEQIERPHTRADAEAVLVGHLQDNRRQQAQCLDDGDVEDDRAGLEPRLEDD